MTCREKIADRHRRSLAWRARCRSLFAAAGGVITRASRLCDRWWLAYFAAARSILGAEGRAIMDAIDLEDFVQSVGAAEDQAQADPGWTPHDGN